MIGTAFAMEVMIGAHDFNAERAEKYGVINRSLQPGGLLYFIFYF